jgi:replicative DNA helicase
MSNTFISSDDDREDKEINKVLATLTNPDEAKDKAIKQWPLDCSREHWIIGAILTDPTFLPKANRYIWPGYFNSARLGRLFSILQVFYNRYHFAADKVILYAELTDLRLVAEYREAIETSCDTYDTYCGLGSAIDIIKPWVIETYN